MRAEKRRGTWQRCRAEGKTWWGALTAATSNRGRRYGPTYLGRLQEVLRGNAGASTSVVEVLRRVPCQRLWEHACA
jgi:hypothetical protein